MGGGRDVDSSRKEVQPQLRQDLPLTGDHSKEGWAPDNTPQKIPGKQMGGEQSLLAVEH